MNEGGRALEDARRLLFEMQNLTGKRYRIPEESLARLGVEALMELRRFTRDMEFEGSLRARRAQMQPWRRP